MKYSIQILWNYYHGKESEEEVHLALETIVGQTKLDDFVPPVRNVLAEIIFAVLIGASAACSITAVVQIPEVKELLSLFFSFE